MVQFMENARPIKGFPGYAIERDGTVWRTDPTMLDSRWGDVPRKIEVVWVGSKGYRKAGVGLYRNERDVPNAKRRAVKKTVLSLLKVAYPEGHTFADEIRRY